MHNLPFNIPKSLSSYVETFEGDEDNVIEKLKRHLKKRGSDAVGYFLLAWFYHVKGENTLAIKQALKAKTYAPGSPLMEHLHYFLVHPELFDAIIPSQRYQSSRRLQQASRTSPVLDLDKLIEMLEAVESQRITIPIDGEPVNGNDLSEASKDVENIVTETLAKIHALQGQKEEAIKMYEKLLSLHPDKADYFNQLIQETKEND